MEDAKTELVDKIKSATNILVTVSRDPSVDQLASLLGLTILLNKQGKHAAAVFSGKVPSTLEFLKPEDTFEKNTDSLRDFIIALDKNKADKLRYKVEDNVVRIFITPYKTSITEDDFEFSQGDFNVDLVIAIGVIKQDDLDEAIVSHGRILHDATVTSITTEVNSELGTINWRAPEASCLSEMVTKLAQSLGSDLIDEQIATAFLTGIVAETNRFSDPKTSSETMSASAVLMSAGANTQLVASKLQGGTDEIDLQEMDASDNESGSLAINHAEAAVEAAIEGKDLEPESTSAMDDYTLPAPSVDSLPSEQAGPSYPGAQMDSGGNLTPGAKMITEPPTLGGQLTSNTQQESYDPSNNPFGMQQEEAPQILSHNSSAPPSDATTQNVPEPATDFSGQLTPPPPAWVPPQPPPPPAPKAPEDVDPTGQTLTQIEEAVGSPHMQAIYPETTPPPSDTEKSVTTPAPENPQPVSEPTPAPQQSSQLDQPNSAPELPNPTEPNTDLGAARDEVTKALGSDTNIDAPQPPIQALGAQQLGPELRPSDLSDDPTTPTQNPVESNSEPQSDDPNAPPPVPPPIPFQFGNPPSAQ